MKNPFPQKRGCHWPIRQRQALPPGGVGTGATVVREELAHRRIASDPNLQLLERFMAGWSGMGRNQKKLDKNQKIRQSWAVKTLRESHQTAYGMLAALQPEVLGLPGETEDLDSIRQLLKRERAKRTVSRRHPRAILV